jgi:hypothetical protein
MTGEFLRDLAVRVGRLEIDLSAIATKVSAIEEKMAHMPTKADLWRTFAVASAAVIGVMWVAVQYLAKPYIDALASRLGG